MATRRPFDPSLIRRKSRAEKPTSDAPLSVRQVNDMVATAIAKHVPPTLHVVGEIGNISSPASGHLYFTLKDADSELRCVMWRSSLAKMKFDPEPGMEIIATGSIEVYTPRGSYQLIARKLEPKGIGALELAFRQMQEKLAAEGLFDEDRKKPIAYIPDRVAIITSPTGAAIRDILQTLDRRFPGLEIFVFPVRVQGEGSAAEIAKAIRQMNRASSKLGGIDVAIIGRGGGSLEDLWAFNEEVVARAIAASRIPIVSAVGHEVDISISDLVADVRAATPTAAAELIAPKKTDLLDWLDTRSMQARRSISHQMQLAQAELRSLLSYEGITRPTRRINDARQMIDENCQQISQAITNQIGEHRKHLYEQDLQVLKFGTGAQYAKLGQQIQRIESRIAGAAAEITLSAERQLTRRLSRLERVCPERRFPRVADKLETVQQRLTSLVSRLVSHRRQVLDAKTFAIHSCAPASVLKRGYSITRDAKTREIIRSVNDIHDKMRITIEVSDGKFKATADDPRQFELFD